jgi:hypothetical protein
MTRQTRRVDSPAPACTFRAMTTPEDRLARLEKRVDALEERFNDALESLADRWNTLAQEAKKTAADVAKVRKEREDERLRVEGGKSPPSKKESPPRG